MFTDTEREYIIDALRDQVKLNCFEILIETYYRKQTIEGATQEINIIEDMTNEILSKINSICKIYAAKEEEERDMLEALKEMEQLQKTLK